MNKKKLLIVAITIIVFCVALGLLYYFFGQIGAMIAALLFSGTAAKQVINHQKIQLSEENQVAKVDLAQTKTQKEFHKRSRKIQNDFLERAKKERLVTKKHLEQVKTQEDLDRETDRFLEEHERFLDNQDGSIRTKLLVCLSFTSIVFGLFFGPLHASKSTLHASKSTLHASKRRTKRLIQLLNRYRNKIIYLQKQHKLALTSQSTNLLLEIEKEKIRRRSCEKRKKLVINAPNPPVWPHMLAGIGMGIVVTGVGCGVFIGMRNRSP